METQKRYKHKQTDRVAVETIEGDYRLILTEKDKSEINIPLFLIENTSDWELIPETPKMEVVEGYSDTGYYFTKQKQGGINDVPTIIIRDYTPEMKAVIKAIERGKCYERWVNKNDKYAIEKGLGVYSNNVKDLNQNPYKILIIPIEQEGE